MFPTKKTRLHQKIDIPLDRLEVEVALFHGHGHVQPDLGHLGPGVDGIRVVIEIFIKKDDVFVIDIFKLEAFDHDVSAQDLVVGGHATFLRVFAIVGHDLHDHSGSLFSLFQGKPQGIEVDGLGQKAEVFDAVGDLVVHAGEDLGVVFCGEEFFPSALAHPENLMVHGLLKGDLTVVVKAFGGGSVVNGAAAFDGDAMEGVLNHEEDVIWGEPIKI